MLKSSYVKVSNGTVSTSSCKSVGVLGAEADVVDLLVMSNQLSLDLLVLDVPDSASRVDGTSA